MKKLVLQGCAAGAAVLMSASVALSAGLTLVDRTGAVVGDLSADNAVVFKISSQFVSFLVQSDGLASVRPNFLYQSNDCMGQQLIFATGLVEYGSYNPDNKRIFFASSSGQDISMGSESYYDPSAKKYECEVLNPPIVFHAAPVRFKSVDALALKPPFKVVPK